MKTVHAWSGATLFLALALTALPATAFAQRGHGGGGGHAVSGRSAGHASSGRVFAGSAGRPLASRAVVGRSVMPGRSVIAGRPVFGQRAGVAVGRPAFRGGFRPGFRGFVSFGRPYYAFRPRFSLGFGLFVGYPFAYPYPYYAYPYPYYYPYYGYDPYYNPYPYYGVQPSYPPPAYGQQPYSQQPYSQPYEQPYDPQAQPSYPPSSYPQSSYPQSPDGNAGVAFSGGLSFEITPSSAGVFVDGKYMGTVGTFTPTSQPLALSPGRHHVEVRAQGYQTMSFEADVVQGQVTPYQGQMLPAR